MRKLGILENLYKNYFITFVTLYKQFLIKFSRNILIFDTVIAIFIYLRGLRPELERVLLEKDSYWSATLSTISQNMSNRISLNVQKNTVFRITFRKRWVNWPTAFQGRVKYGVVFGKNLDHGLHRVLNIC